MVKYKPKKIDAVFHALSSAPRRTIICQLAKGNLVLADIAKRHNMSLPAVSKHLKVLEKAGLLQRQREGRSYHFGLRKEPLDEAKRLIEKTYCLPAKAFV